MREGIDLEHKGYIKPNMFYVCLREYLETDMGNNFKDSLRFRNDTSNPLD